MHARRPALAALVVLRGTLGLAAVYNLRVVTDASPDYHDMGSMVRSITSRWETPAEKCWAVFYWNHIARRQTAPMDLHGMALTDPIRQFNDYGYTMCSTVSGVNQSIWEHMGLPHRYWDISNHTVAEVQYDGRWHMYDGSMSAIYTLCDGETIAAVEDIGKEGACGASGGKSEPGHVARYHCLNATSPNGFLTGADCPRDLEQEYRCFKPSGLKHRYYFHDWDYGHRYILNLRRNETYTRWYRKLGDSAEFYVPNPDGRPGGKDPDAANRRYRIRGNGRWVFVPDLGRDGYAGALHSSANIAPDRRGGLRPAKARRPAEAVFKVQSANVTTSQVIRAAFARKSERDEAALSVSTNNGISWKEVWKAGAADAPPGGAEGELAAEVKLVEEVTGAYEVLVKVTMTAAESPADVRLASIEIETVTMLNSKTQPGLNLGRNTVHVGAGEQADSIVFWPELQGGRYREHVADERNIACVKNHIGYQGALHPEAAGEDAWVVYRIDAPRDLAKLTYGGRFYNRAPKSRIEMLHSFDGESWTRTWTLTKTDPPWDVIRYETVPAPAGSRSAWVKYLMNTSEPAPSGCSIYAVRMEANHLPADGEFAPVEVTFTWKEMQADRSLVERSHAELVTKLPHRYVVNVGGTDHPVMESLRVGLQGAVEDVTYGYSDGKDAGGERFVGRWVTYGTNLAVGKSYTCSVPSATNWGAGDPDGTKLTDGVVGPPYAGGTSYRSGAIWTANQNPVITLDLGEEAECASFGLNIHGYPWWDALRGEVKDEIEVLVSRDGERYESLGRLKTDIRWRELPVNHMWTDEETMRAATFRLIPGPPAGGERPVKARHVQFRVRNRRFFDVTEIEVLDSISYEPFDLRIALPDG